MIQQVLQMQRQLEFSLMMVGGFLDPRIQLLFNTNASMGNEVSKLLQCDFLQILEIGLENYLRWTDGDWLGKFPNLIIRPKKKNPNHNFSCWLSQGNRLSTKDRMIQWGYQGNNLRVFCRMKREIRDYIFFDCSISRRIWQQVKVQSLMEDSGYDWGQVLQWSNSA